MSSAQDVLDAAIEYYRAHDQNMKLLHCPDSDGNHDTCGCGLMKVTDAAYRRRTASDVNLLKTVADYLGDNISGTVLEALVPIYANE